VLKYQIFFAEVKPNPGATILIICRHPFVQPASHIFYLPRYLWKTTSAPSSDHMRPFGSPHTGPGPCHAGRGTARKCCIGLMHFVIMSRPSGIRRSTCVDNPIIVPVLGSLVRDFENIGVLWAPERLTDPRWNRPSTAWEILRDIWWPLIRLCASLSTRTVERTTCTFHCHVCGDRVVTKPTNRYQSPSVEGMDACT
jgi:hypothetical protein